MISKAVRGRGFSGCVSYVCEKSDAVRTVNIVSENWKHAASEMRAVAAMNSTKKCVYHHWLSFSPDERLDDEQMFAAASSMIEKLGLADHQHVLAIHRDREHAHIHIVSNLVSFDGKAVKLSHDFRSRPVYAREIEKELNLKAFQRKERDKSARFPPEKIDAIRAAARSENRDDLDRLLTDIGVTMSEKSSRSKAVNFTFTDTETGARIAGSKIDPSLSSPTTVKGKERQSDGLWLRYSEAKALHPTIDEKAEKAKSEAIKLRHKNERKSVRGEHFEIRKEMLQDTRKLRLPQADQDAIRAVSAARLAKDLELLEIRHRADRKAATARFPNFKEWLHQQAASDLSAAIRLAEMGYEKETAPTIAGTEFTINSDGTVDFRDEQGNLLFTNTSSGVRFAQHTDQDLRERAIIAGLRVELAHGRKFEFGSDPKVRAEIIDIAGRNGLRLPGLTHDEEERWKSARNAKPASAPQPSASNTAPTEKAQDWQPEWTAAIQQAVSRSADANELISALGKAGITVEEVIRANGNRGVAFSKDGVRVTGSSLQRDLSWQKIGETLADNRHRRMADNVDIDDEAQRADARLDFEIMQRETSDQKATAAAFFNRIARAAKARAPLIEAAKFAAAATLSARDRRRFTPSPGSKNVTLADIEREIVNLFRSKPSPKLYSMSLQEKIHQWASKGLIAAQANLAQQQKEIMNVGRSNVGR